MGGDTSQDMRYAPPQAHVEDVEVPEGGLVLATRMQRFWASMIDLVIVMAAVWVASLVTPWNPWARAGSVWSANFVNPAIGFVLFAAIQGVLLARRGQTAGKALMGVRIVRFDGERASGARLLLLRYGVGYLTTIVMPIGQVYGLVDALMIFRSSRRCLHDLIADTIVVKA
jgi:uncharacterized RDD family membrane protein YckC